MLDLVKAACGHLARDETVFGLLRRDEDAICRVKAVSEKIKPRVEVTLVAYEETDWFDDRPACVLARLAFTAYSDKSEEAFRLISAVDELVKRECGFSQAKYQEGYVPEIATYYCDFAYDCKARFDRGEAEGFTWVAARG